MIKKLKTKELVPNTYRNRLYDSLCDNIFDKFVSNTECSTHIGYIKNGIKDKESNYISASNLDREYNALIPSMYSEIGTDYNIFNFDDLKNKLKILGIDEYRIKDILSDKSFNFYLPIDLDKFCNYAQYYWVSELSPAPYNTKNIPEYIVIDSLGKSEWATYNYWLHKEDFSKMGYDITKAKQAKRPIIEYNYDMELCLNSYHKDGKPCDINTTNAIYYQQTKTRINQYPLFDLYDFTGKNVIKTSSIIKYREDENGEIDKELLLKIKIDSKLDYVMNIDMFNTDNSLLFYKNNNKLVSVWYHASNYSPSFITVNDDNKVINESDIINNIDNVNYTWEYPKQYFSNIHHETKSEIKYADLLTHFLDILRNNDTLIGSPFGNNNYRDIKIDYSKGGKIKDFDGGFDLFVSIMNMKNTDYVSLIRFAQYSYELFLSDIHEYIKKVELENYLSNQDTFSSPEYFKKLKDEFLIYTSKNSIFKDSTSYYKGIPLTLPYMGLCEKVRPYIKYDEILKMDVLIHHDGHISPTAKNDIEYKKQTALRTFIRSDGLEVAGYVSNIDPITLGAIPYKKQIWYDTDKDKLFIFDVAFDILDKTVKTLDKSYGFDRTTKKVYFYSNNKWSEVKVGLSTLWKEYSYKDTIKNLTLSIETDLYNSCPNYNLTSSNWTLPITKDKIDSIRNSNAVYFDNILEEELYRYGVIKNVNPFTNVSYKKNDPFTWNYSSVSVYGKNYSTWYNMYQNLFGDLSFYKDHKSFNLLNINYYDGLLLAFNKNQVYIDGYTFYHNDKHNPFPHQILFDNGTYYICDIDSIKINNKIISINGKHDRLYDYDINKVIENGVANDLDNYYIVYYNLKYEEIPLVYWNATEIALGRTLPINPYTSELLPPFVDIQALKSQSLVKSISPHKAQANFGFNTLGFFEYIWKHSIAYRYAICIALFKVNPYKFINATWGYDNKEVQDGINTMNIDRFLNKKRSNKDYILHGELDNSDRKSNLLLADNNGRLDIQVTSNFVRKIEIVMNNGNWIVNEYEEELLSASQKKLGIVPNWMFIKSVNIGKTNAYFNTDLHITIYPSIFPRYEGDKYEIIIKNKNVTYNYSTQNIVYEYALKLEVAYLLPNLGVSYRVDLVKKQVETEYHKHRGIKFEWELESHKGFINNSSATFNNISFTVLDESNLKIGDIFFINLDLVSNNSTWSFIPSPTHKIHGFNQFFVNTLRYNNIDIFNSEDVSIYRDWKVKLSWRTSSLMNTDNLHISTDYYNLANDNFRLKLKQNTFADFAELQSLRVSLIRIGTVEIEDGIRKPKGNGDDFVYRIEPLNKNSPTIGIYLPDTNSDFITFNALSSNNCKAVWKKYNKFAKDENGNDRIIFKNLPMEVRGIQTVIDILYGYVNYIKKKGWEFNNSEYPQIDEDTGRVIDWNLEIERFIDSQYRGIHLNKGYLLSPFKKKVWYRNKIGIVSEFKNKTWNDSKLTPFISDLYGNRIEVKHLRVIREDELTEIISDVPMFYVNLNVSTFEHILLLDDYTLEDYLIFDPFLGICVDRIHIRGERQNTHKGNLTLHGYFGKNNVMYGNLDKSISDLSDMYDIHKLQEKNTLTEAVKQQMGFTEMPYYKNLNLSEKGKMQLWQGFIKNKGTNFSVESFINNKRYKTAKIDEFWALKIADFGDARKENHTEVNLKLKEHKTDYSHFVMDDNQEYIPKDAIFLNSNDERIWHDIIDLNNKTYFEATKHYIGTFTITNLGYFIITENNIYPEFTYAEPKIENINVELEEKRVLENDVTILKIGGAEVNRKKTFVHERLASYDFYSMEVLDDNFKGIIIPEGEHDLIPNLKSYVTFNKINSHVIEITDEAIIGYTVKLYGYNPSFSLFNPSKLINNKTKNIDAIIEMYDPARKKYKEEILQNVDMYSDNDPARYNTVLNKLNNENYQPTKVWNKNEVGRIWLNTSKLGFYPYYDYKRYTNLYDRVTRWGAIADWANIEVNQWIESNVPPEKYKGSGVPSQQELFVRNRKWYARPIIWKKQIDYDNQIYKVDYEGEFDIILENNRILSKQDFNNYNIKKDGFIYGLTKIKSINEDDGEIIYNDGLYFGEAKIKSEMYYVIKNNTFEDDFMKINITLNNNSNNIGDIKFQKESLNNYTFIQALINDKSQSLIISDIPKIQDYVYNLNYNQLGFSITIVIKNIELYVDNIDVRISNMINNILSIKAEIYSALDIEKYIEFELDKKINNFGNKESEINWIYNTKPSYTDIKNDANEPYNLYIPELGYWKEVNISKDLIYNEIKNRKTYLHLNNRYDNYKYEWSDYIKVEPYIHKFVYLRYDDLYKEGINEIQPEMYLNGKRIYEVSYDNDVIAYNIPIPEDEQNNDIFLFGLDSIITENSTTDFVIMNALDEVNRPNINKMQVLGIPTEIEELSSFDISITGAIPFTYTNYKSGLKIGDEIVLKVKRYEPSDDELNFNPDKDDPRILQQYTFSYPYTIESHINDNNQVFYKYYYWVKLNSNIHEKKTVSNFNLAESFRKQDDLFMGFTNIVGEEDDTLSSGLYIDYHYGKVNKGNTEFNVPFSLKENRTILFLSGVKQIEGMSYFVRNRKIIFDEPLDSDVSLELYQLNHRNFSQKTRIEQVNVNDNKINSMNFTPDFTWVYLSGVKQIQDVSFSYIDANNILLNEKLTFITDCELVQYNPVELQTNRAYIVPEFADITLPFEFRSGNGLFVFVEGIKQVIDVNFKILDRQTILFLSDDIVGKNVEVIYMRTKNNNTYNSDVSLVPNPFIDESYEKADNSIYKPIRYNEFFIKGLNNKLKKYDNYKLRLTRDYILRDDPYGIDKKPYHSEWIYIRENQYAKIDKKLWQHLIDSLCGETLFGQKISVNQYKLYDERNNTSTRFGLESGQVFLDKNEAIDIVINTLRNTNQYIEYYDEYGNQVLVKDEISFDGYSNKNLEYIFSDNVKIRIFMGDIYQFAKPNSINEIFFNVLKESLSKRSDYAGVLKTSMLALYGVKLMDKLI